MLLKPQTAGKDIWPGVGIGLALLQRTSMTCPVGVVSPVNGDQTNIAMKCQEDSKIHVFVNNFRNDFLFFSTELPLWFTFDSAFNFSHKWMSWKVFFVAKLPFFTSIIFPNFITKIVSGLTGNGRGSEMFIISGRPRLSVADSLAKKAGISAENSRKTWEILVKR